MENLKGKIDELLDEYQNRIKTTSYGENDHNIIGSKLSLNANGWFVQMINKIINETLEKFKDYHYNNIKSVESLTININS